MTEVASQNPAESAASDAMIEIRGLSKQYGGEGETVTVFDGLDFRAAAGSIASVEGASGEGKSTLLNIIGSIDSASAGEVRVEGRDVTRMSEREKEAFRAERVGLIFQHHYLLPDFTVLENAMMPMLIQRRPAPEARREAEEKLELVGLGHRLRHFPSQISGGEMARAGVARALAGGKRLLLADEPTGNLDKSNSDRLADLLWRLQGELNFTLLIVTHDMDLAARVPNRWRLKAGRLEAIRS